MIKDIFSIYLMLGSRCNFRCKYCRICEDATNLVVPDLPTEINPEIYDFIDKCAYKGTFPLRIMFYGGEPLLYFETIKEIVKNTEGMNVEYALISNGSLITEEHVKYFNEHGFKVAISWEGKDTLYTREHDVFSENENLYALNNLGISSVITALMDINKFLDDAQAIQVKYRELTGKNISVHCQCVVDLESKNRDLFAFDFDKLEKDVAGIINEVVALDTDVIGDELYTKYWAKSCFVTEFLVKGTRYELRGPNPYLVNCSSNGIYALAMDLQGNFYACHNKYDKIGDLNTQPARYIANLLASDNTNKYYDECSKCEVYPMCVSGCKLLTKEIRDAYYCKLQKALNRPFMELIVNAGRKDLQDESI